MGINSDELLSEAAAFEFWTTGITSLEQARREQLWNTSELSLLLKTCSM